MKDKGVMKRQWMLALAAVGTAAGLNAKEVEFSELPSKAQQTINKHLSGGAVKSIEEKAYNGQTVFEVEIRREGRDRELWVDSNGQVVQTGRTFQLDEPIESRADSVGGPATVDVDVDHDNDDGILDKNDGKILGVIPAPGADDKKLDAEARVGDAEIDIEGRADVDTDVDVDRRDLNADVDVDTDVDDDGVFSKTDGKILGVFPAPGRDEKRIEGEARVGDAKVDVEADADLDDHEVELSSDVDHPRDNKIFQKGDGKILGIPVNRAEDARVDADVDVDTDNDLSAEAEARIDRERDLSVGAAASSERGAGGNRDNLALKALPQPVQQTIAREVGVAEGLEINKIDRDGRMAYEVKVKKDGLDRTFEVDRNGQVVRDSQRR